MSQINFKELSKIYLENKGNKKLASEDKSKLSEIFTQKCYEDARYRDLYEKNETIKKIDLYYTKEKMFTKTRLVQKGEYAEDDIYSTEFDAELYNKSKYWAENWQMLKQEELDKIEALNNKFTFFKNSKIKKAENNLSHMEFYVDKYNFLQKNTTIKEEILKEHSGSLENLQNEMKILENEIAYKLFDKHVMDYPNTIIIEQDEIEDVDISKESFYVSNRAINETSNELRESVEDYIKEKFVEEEEGVQFNTVDPIVEEEEGVQFNTVDPIAEEEEGVQFNTVDPVAEEEEGVQFNTVDPIVEEEEGVQFNTVDPVAEENNEEKEEQKENTKEDETDLELSM